MSPAWEFGEERTHCLQTELKWVLEGKNGGWGGGVGSGTGIGKTRIYDSSRQGRDWADSETDRPTASSGGLSRLTTSITASRQKLRKPPWWLPWLPCCLSLLQGVLSAVFYCLLCHQFEEIIRSGKRPQAVKGRVWDRLTKSLKDEYSCGTANTLSPLYCMLVCVRY